MGDSKHLRSISRHRKEESDSEAYRGDQPSIPADPSRAKQLSTDHTLSEESWPRLMCKRETGDRFSAGGHAEDFQNNIIDVGPGNKSTLAGVKSFWRSLPLTLRKCEERSE